MAAVWLFGSLLCLLLFAICLQLRALRRQVANVMTRRPVDAAEAELPLEAWLQELEARGAEIMQRLERQYEALRAQGTAGELAGGSTGGNGSRRPLYVVPQADEAHVQDWVRRHTEGDHIDSDFHTRWATARQRIGQDWNEIHTKVRALAGRGMSAANIARTLGLSQGEVQLILSNAKNSAPR